MITQKTLNPALFHSLKRVLGEVDVTHPGEPFEARLVRDLGAEWPRLHVIHYGETYKVPCPFCRAPGLKLSVNHRFGTYDNRIDWPLDYLATCFARGCLTDRSRRTDLIERLGGADFLAGARVLQGTTAPVIPDRLPASFMRLDRLRPTHPARADLVALGHDPDRLGRMFGVGYCPDADVPLADERVVAPVRQRGKLVGWLAAEFANGPVRFMAAQGMAASKYLYNLDRAKKYSTVVVVPSPEWVWRVGTAAVAPLISPDAERHGDLLRRAIRDRNLVVAGVPGGYEKAEALAAWLNRWHQAKVAYVRLPSTVMTASRVELQKWLRAAAAAKGIEVTFAKLKAE